MSRTAKTSAIAGIVAFAVAIAGCASASPPASSEAEPTAAIAPATDVTDVETCDAFGDVGTIVANADTALAEGRSELQERDGWYRLATRVLDRLPTTGSGPVHDAIEQLKDAAPAIKLGAIAEVDFRSMKWVEAERTLLDACDAAGAELAIEGFTGG